MVSIAARFDDAENRQGRLVKAEHLGIPLQFGKRKCKLDLSDTNFQALNAVLDAWFDAVEAEATPVVSVPSPTFSETTEGTTQQVWPDPITGQPGPYALKNSSGRWALHPGLTSFMANNGDRRSGRVTDEETIHLYCLARDDGSFVPSPESYPPHKQPNRV